MASRYWVETLGCPKNQVDSDKLAGTLEAGGLLAAASPGDADVVVVNTCAFIEAARQESIDAILALSDARRPGARLVVTGCLAERYGAELAGALPEVDQVAGFGVPLTTGMPARAGVALPEGVPVSIGAKPGSLRAAPVAGGAAPVAGGAAGAPPAPPLLDLLNLPRPASRRPWAYVKIAEGCDRSCGFCAIPSFRGRQRSRSVDAILDEVEALDVQEVVLVAQDLASYGRDVPGMGTGSIVGLVEAVAARVARTRLLYLYPSDLTDGLIDVIGGPTGVPYFDLSLQHVSKPLLRRMRRWGDGERFLARIADIRERYPEAAFRSSFIVGYPGETEDDHDRLLRFVEEAELDWVGFFAYSPEEGTLAAGLDGQVDGALVAERLLELGELQDEITAARRRDLVGERVEVLVDAPGVARSHREAPEIDGVVQVPADLPPGAFRTVTVTAAYGPDLEAA